MFEDLYQPWYQRAACTEADPEIFFPPRDKELYKKIAAEAKTFCFGSEDRPPCPVRNICLWDAVSREEQHGIWGGLSHRERNALVRKWQKQYRSKMTLKEFILKVNSKGKINGNTKV